MCRVFDDLVDDAHDGEVVSVEPLLWAWRQMRPRWHPGAGDDEVDVASLADVCRRRPDALSTPLRPVDDDPRRRPVRQQVARCLADACILGLEQQKLRHGLTAPAEALKAAFATRDAARATLEAVRDAAVPAVEVGHVVVDVSRLTGLAKTAVHVVAGVPARRLQDLLSPYVRRLRVDLALLGRGGGVIDDDDVYRGLERLNEREPGCVRERRDGEDKEGISDDGCIFVVDVARLVDDGVDRRARSLLAPLKKQGAIIVGVVDTSALAAVLAATRPQTVQLLATATATTTPRALTDGAGGVALLAGNDGPALSVPATGWLPHNDGDARDDDDDDDAAADAFFAWSVAARAHADDDGLPAPSLALAMPKDESEVALRALAALVPARQR